MKNIIKNYTVLLFFLTLGINQSFACNDCWLTKLESILDTTGDTSFKRFVREDSDAYAKFENLYKSVGESRIEELLDPDILNLFIRFDDELKNTIVRKLDNEEIQDFSNDFAFNDWNVSLSTEAITGLNTNPELINSWKLLNDPWLPVLSRPRQSISELKRVAENYNEIVRHSGKYLGWLDDSLGRDIRILMENANFEGFYYLLRYDELPRYFENSLSIEEEAILKFYTTNEGYLNFNKALRGDSDIAMTDFFRTQEQLMIRALNKISNSSHNNRELLRIENLSDEGLANRFQIGEIAKMNFFRSATYSVRACAEALIERAFPTPVLIRIQGRSGKDIEILSTLPSEKEILFSSERQFKVTRIDESPDPRPNIEKIRTVWLEEI